MRGQETTKLVDFPGEPYSWIVVRTKPRQEKIAISHLAQRQVTPYCPMFLQPPWHPRAPRGPVPLFTGYIFVNCDLETRLNAVRFCPGVLAPVAFNGRIAVVDQGLIDALRFREADRGYALPDEQIEGIPEGTSVRVMAGPFEGISGVFKGYLRGGQRAKILMDFLRNRHEVEVDTDVLAKQRA
jgi:hypothetical protein